MKLALLSDYPLPGESPRGAMQNNGVQLTAALRNIPGLEIHVVTCRPFVSRVQIHRQHGMTIHYLPHSKRFGMLTLFQREASLIKQTLANIRPNIIHSQGAEMDSFVVSDCYSPWVMTVHGIRWYEARYAKGMDRLRILLQSLLLQQVCFRRAHHIICPSPYVRSVLAGRTKARLYDVEHTVDSWWFEVEHRPQSQQFLYLASLTRRKRLLDLVEAFKIVREQFPNARLRVAGDPPKDNPGDMEYYKQVRQRITALGLDRATDFVGYLDRDRLIAEFEQAIAMVLPSGQETAPIAVNSAMAAGVPVVATRVGGVPWLIQDGLTGYLTDVGDVKGMAEVLLRLLSNPQLARQIGAQARQSARERFHPLSVGRRTWAVYCEILETLENQPTGHSS